MCGCRAKRSNGLHGRVGNIHKGVAMKNLAIEAAEGLSWLARRRLSQAVLLLGLLTGASSAVAQTVKGAVASVNDCKAHEQIRF